MKLTKQTKNYLFFLFLFLFIFYVSIYFIYIYSLSRLHHLQTKPWITELTDNLILGIKDQTYLYKVQQSNIKNISFYYNYFFFHTKKYSIFVLFNLNNKYSDSITLNVYLYNFEKNTSELSQSVLDFNDLKTSKEGDILFITLGNSYSQKINMITNKMELTLHLPAIHLQVELDIDDYTTNLPTFLPRYDTIKGIIKPYFPVTTTPGEWCSDNPMIGKIINGSLNHERMEDGNFWFDNFIGVNDFFLASYVWYIVLNDDWLIYKLWFGEYEKKNKTCFFIIKDRKNNKVLRSGISGGIVPAFQCMDNFMNPVKCDYKSTKKMGDLNYDNFHSYFETDEIKVTFDSIKDESHRIFCYDYYDSFEKTNVDKNFDIINNCKYIEYVNQVNVTITYNGKTETFRERCIIDSMSKEDKSIPDTF
jgi:hypothetical protein